MLTSRGTGEVDAELQKGPIPTPCTELLATLESTRFRIVAETRIRADVEMSRAVGRSRRTVVNGVLGLVALFASDPR